MQEEEIEQEYDYDEDFQQKILSLMLQDKDFLASSAKEVIKPHYFTSKINKNLCNWIFDFYDEYSEIPDQSALYNRLRKYSETEPVSQDEYEEHTERIKYLSKVTVTDSLYVKDEVVAFAKEQAFGEALEKIVTIYNKSDSKNYEKSVQIMEEALSAGAGLDLGLSFKDSIKILPKILNKKYDRTRLIRTGIESLDRAMLGGMGPGEVHLAVGKSGIGKSRFLGHCATAALTQKKDVMIFTHELSEEDYMQIIASKITGMDFKEMTDPKNYDEYLRRLEKATRLNFNLRIKYFPNKSVTTDHMRTYLSRLYATEKFKPSLIICDYADLILPTKASRGGGDYEDMGNVFYDLKKLADVADATVLTGSQSQRHSWNLPLVEEEHLADSARKAHIAYSVLTLNQLKKEELENKFRIYIAKMRRGYRGQEIFCNFDKGRVILSETSEEWDVKSYVTKPAKNN